MGRAESERMKRVSSVSYYIYTRERERGVSEEDVGHVRVMMWRNLSCWMHLSMKGRYFYEERRVVRSGQVRWMEGVVVDMCMHAWVSRPPALPCCPSQWFVQQPSYRLS